MSEIWFDDKTLRRINADTCDGSGLPNQAYTSDAFYMAEQQHVFKRQWVFAAFCHDISHKGDMMPINVAGQPLLVVRGEDDQVRVFHNVCRHRGAQLCLKASSGNRNLTCPNHSWSYSLKGRLLTRPHFYGGGNHDINREEIHRSNLVEIRSQVWHDWIFVNIDGNAVDFDEAIRPVTSRLEGYDLSVIQYSEQLDFDINANWKLAIENFIEPYHVFSCHPWLNGFVSMEERTPPQFDHHILHCGYHFKNTDPARGEGLPYFPDLNQEQRHQGIWFVLFPNFAFEVFPDQVDVFIATPISAKQCRETIALYFVGEGASRDDYAQARQRVIQNWHDLNQEDIGVIERMQAGRNSDGFDGGVLSPYWDPVQQQFARLVFDSFNNTRHSHLTSD